MYGGLLPSQSLFLSLGSSIRHDPWARQFLFFCLPLVPAPWRQSEIKLPGGANQRQELHLFGPHNPGTPIIIHLGCRNSLRIHGYPKHLDDALHFTYYDACFVPFWNTTSFSTLLKLLPPYTSVASRQCREPLKYKTFTPWQPDLTDLPPSFSKTYSAVCIASKGIAPDDASACRCIIPL